jgi:simple sugar transport system ATP-binding protein
MHVHIDQVTKIFGTLRANDAISMMLESGKLYAILGENGAGKSTLMKILSGYQPADSGQIRIDDAVVHFDTPADALAHGIGMLHQEPLDIAPLTALENFILGSPTGLFPDRRAARERFTNTVARLGFYSLRPDALIESLTIGERQQLEIARLISLGARLLILDEPTTGISAEQKATLFATLKALAHSQGLTVTLVSHKLEDVEALCDHVYVLRSGKVVGDAPMPISTAQMVEMMFGKRIDAEPRQNARGKPEVVLTMQNVGLQDQRLSVDECTLAVNAGQVIGLAGLDGSGQRAFLRACAGLERLRYGRILLGSEDVTGKSYHYLSEKGVAFTPAGRLEEGLISGLTIAEHFALARHAGGIRINLGRSAIQADEQIARYSIRGKPQHQIQNLSGGNQQRVLLSMLPPDLRLLLLENPTRGLDVESSRFIWSKLLERRDQGAAIVFVSPDLDEIIQYSDRIAVFFGGRMTLIDDPATVTAADLGQLIGGKRLTDSAEVRP